MWNGRWKLEAGRFEIGLMITARFGGLNQSRHELADDDRLLVQEFSLFGRGWIIVHHNV